MQFRIGIKLSAAIILLLLSLLATSLLQAANKVVVVPLLGSSAKPISNVVTVAKKNGDFTDPIAAIASITDTSAENPYVVFIAPGVYTLDSQLHMKSYVDVTGSGRNVTILTGSISSAKLNGSAALVALEGGSTLSNVTINNQINENSNNYIVAVDVRQMGKIRDSLIFVQSSGINGDIYGIYSEFGLGYNQVQHCEISVFADVGSATGIFSKSGISIRDNIIAVGCLFGPATGIKSYGVNGNKHTIERCHIEIEVGNIGGNPALNYRGIECGNGNTDILNTNIKFLFSGPSGNARGVLQTTSSSQVNIRDSLIEVLDPLGGTSSMSISGVANARTIVSQSTLVGPIDGESTKRCIASGNGSGVLLNPDCTTPN